MSSYTPGSIEGLHRASRTLASRTDFLLGALASRTPANAAGEQSASSGAAAAADPGPGATASTGLVGACGAFPTRDLGGLGRSGNPLTVSDLRASCLTASGWPPASPGGFTAAAGGSGGGSAGTASEEVSGEI